jgi:hypothetical protein
MISTSPDFDAAAGRRWRLPVEYVLLGAALCLATGFVTWPHAQRFTSHVVAHIDPLFSMWRLAWFAHATATGEHLLHANIFYPEPYTLLLSDAMFLEGAIAAPAIWAGIALPAVYNMMLLVGIVSSGIAIYWLATLLGISRLGGAVAAVIFSLAPYRIEHVMHLELQWAAPAILAFGALYRALFAPRWRHGVLLGVAVTLQFLSSIYYGVFLVPLLAVLAAAALPRVPDPRRTIRVGLLALAICVALTAPVVKIYMDQRLRIGERAQEEITSYSATPLSYLASPKENAVYGWTADRFGAGEKRLFPGAAALVLAVLGLFSHRRRIVVAAALVALVAWELSLGANGGVYPLLLESWPPLRGLRASARYGLFVLAGIAMLAALGCERLALLRRASRRGRVAIACAAAAVLLIEYRSPLRHLERMDMDPPVYEFLRQQPRTVLLELPLPTRDERAIDLDVDYTFWSTRHWHRLLNGYSGYYPWSYEHTLSRLRGFPDKASLAFLRERDVRYIVVHTEYLRPTEASRLLAAMLRRHDLVPLGSYHDWAASSRVFELKR